MKKVIQKRAADQLRGHIFHRRWMKVVTCLAAVVVFITTYLLILPAITMERTTVCGMEEHVHSDACYTELQVLKCTLEENEEHTHIEDCYETERILTCSQEEHTHTEECYASEEEGTEETGTEVTEGTEELQSAVYTYEDDSLTVTAELPTDSTVPADAQLRVTPITEQNENYDTLTEQAQQAVFGQTEQIVLYDVSFYVNGENGEEYLPVSESAKVSFQFKDAILQEPQGVLSVLHYEQEQGTPVPLMTVEMETDENDTLTALTFETEGFSIFAMVKVYANQQYEEIEVADDTVLDGNSYLIISNTRNYTLSNTATDSTGILKVATGGTGADWSGLAVWTFSKNADGTYLIYSGGNYLTMDTYGDMDFTTDPAAATHFTVTAHKNMALISYGSQYINNYGGDGVYNYFHGYNVGQSDNGSHLRLYQAVASSTTVKDLDGKTFAIYNQTTGVAMTTSALTVDGASGLGCTSATLQTIDGVNYVIGNGIALWSFEDAGVEGEYYISTQVEGVTKYLNMTDNTTGDLTLTDTKKAITVRAVDSGDGQVLLGNGNSSGGYINSSTSSGYNFWVWHGTNNYSSQTLCQVVELPNTLIYDLNLPSLQTVSGSKYWETTPTLTNSIQEFTGDSALFSKPEGWYDTLGYAGELFKEKNPSYTDDTTNPFYGLYRMHVIMAGNLVSNNKPTEHMTEEEYMFLGWSYTGTDGIKHLLEPGAEAKLQADGSIQIMDKNGDTVTLPGGATLEGEWVQISAPVYFYINYEGTILDTEGDVAGRGNAFLNGTAIGHILFAQETVGGYGTFALEVHEAISAMFRSKDNVDLKIESDGSVPDPQIIIETATTATGEDLTNNEEYGEANAKIILAATLSWLQAKSDVDLYISTGNGLTKAQSDQLTTDNYSIRWYVVKEQYDAWHIDGVLTAVTKPLVVTKSFAGLPDEEIEKLLDEDTVNGVYAIDLWIRGNNESATYMTLQTTEKYTEDDGVTYKYGVPGQYTYDGYDSTTKTAQWTVRLLAGEHATLSEKGYGLSEYITSAYSVIDGNADTIYTGTKTGYDVSETEKNDIYDIVGGKNGVVSFSNTYTKKGKGSLSILKKDKDTGAVLQNVTFTLTNQDTDTAVTDTTDDSGRADFMNLEPGIYLLTEAKPVGYLENTNKITVTVSEPDTVTGVASVTVEETTADGLTVIKTETKDTSLLYTIENEMESNTMIVEKEFKEISLDEVKKLAENYRITLSCTDADWTERILTVDNAVYRSADGLRYRWLIQTVGSREITVTESGYRTDAYIDTYVTAEITVGETVTEKDATVTKEVVGDKTIYKASVSLNTNASALNRVILTNTYTNEFSLYLQKKDSITGQPLQGAVFALYGSYEEATNAKKTIQYKDALGEIHTLYYIGDTEASDENGLALVKGLNLSNAGKTYAYVLSEITAPDGYAKPSYPDGIVPPGQVITVTVENIDNNVYSTEMVNQTIGAPLIIQKKVPKNDLGVEESYDLEITISANTESVRLSNRVYSYQKYNSSDEKQGSIVQVYGSAELNKNNVDTCTFSVSLKKDEYIVIDDVPIGYYYSVKESRRIGYDCSIVNENGTGSYDNYLKTANGTVLEVPDEIKDTTDSGYEQNVIDRKLNTVTVNNYKTDAIKDTTTKITVIKEWLPAGKAGTEAIIRLYQVSNGNLDTATAYTADPTRTLNEANSWTDSWENLPLYNEDGSISYDYYIAEDLIPGFSQSYNFEPVQLTVDSSEIVTAVHATTATVTVTNTTGYELPDSGSTGTLPIILIGMVLAAGSILSGYRRKRKRERRLN